MIGITVLLALMPFSASAYKEHPLLTKMVEKGLLPPVDERVPQEPRVVKPLHMQGRYGGTARIPFSGNPNEDWDLQLFFGADSPFGVTPDGQPGDPLVFRGYEVNDDYTEWIFHLRKGLKWSDGHPLTTENFYQFWRYDRANTDISPGIKLKNVKIEENKVTFTNEPGEGLEVGRVVTKEVIDDYTLRYTSPEPYPNLVHMMSNGWMIESWIEPMHYKLKFHPDIVGEETAKKRAQEAGFEEWHQLYKKLKRSLQSSHQANLPGKPTLMSYVITDKTETRIVYERNPYYWAVDTEGHQLPYVDKVVANFLNDNKMIDGKIISGEADFVGLHTTTTSMPLYKRYEKKGNYRMEVWDNAGNNPALDMLTSTDDEVMRELIRTKEFRQALSISVNRQRIIDEVYNGIGKPIRNTLMPGSPWYREEFATAYAEYDPEKAKKMLDKLGVVDSDGDGWREDPQGRDIEWKIEFNQAHVGRPEPLEIIANGWQQIGFNVDIKEYELGHLRQRSKGSNKAVMTVWHKSMVTPQAFPVVYTNSGLPQRGISWFQWEKSGGSAGEEGPPVFKEVIDLFYNKLAKAKSKEDRIKWGLKVNEIRAENVWTIETVSYSPSPVIVASDLINFPTKADGPLLFIWDTWWTNPYVPAQFFFEKRPQINESQSKLFEYYDSHDKDWIKIAKEKGWL